MSLAPPYNPTASFSNDETNQVSGRSTVRTVAVDTELANIATTVNALKSNLEKLQRDDDKLIDFLVEPYALAEQTRALIAAGGRPRGLWAAGQVYAVGDVVQQTGFAYQCYTAHTAAAPFTANGFWISISGDGSAATNAAAAAASGAAATAAAAAAAASVTAAGVSATAAAASATTAGTSATAAGNSATAAGLNAAAAAVSVGHAATSANAANASAIAADASAAAAAAAVGATIALTNDGTTNAPHYLTFADGTAGQENLKTDTAKLVYNPSTGALSAASFVGSGAGLTAESVPRAALPALFVLGTAVTLTTQTAVDFTGIPSWAKRITLMLSNASTNGTSPVQIQIGDSGGIETSGYVGAVGVGQQSQNWLVTALSAGFAIDAAAVASAANVFSGFIELVKVTGNTWAATGQFGQSVGSAVRLHTLGGHKPLSDVLTQIRLTTVGGTDQFDAGTVNISYE